MDIELGVIIIMIAVVGGFMTGVVLAIDGGEKIPRPPRKLKPKAKPLSNWDVMLINVDDIDKAK